MRLSDIDLLDRDVFARGVPHEWFAILRREAPVYRHPKPDGTSFWVISKHEDIVAVGRDWQRNSSARELGGIASLDAITEEKVRVTAEINDGRELMGMDPPEHTSYRKVVNKGFTPRLVGLLEPRVRELTTEVLDRAIAKGELDFVRDIAAELPLLVISELLGAPAEDRDKIFAWSNLLTGSEDPEILASAEQFAQAAREIYAYADRLAVDRRRCPHDDIATTLVNAEVDGERLSANDFSRFFRTLAVAGNETTRYSSAHGMHAFLENPSEYEALVDDPSLISTAVEEILRWATPPMYFRRNVTEDYELRGQQIRAGEIVSLWYISGNRDEDVFADPFTFDIRRSPNPHIAFGGGGPHYCLGASLARLQLRVLFEELIDRVPKVEAVGEPVRLRSNFMNGLKHLPVRLHARS